MSPSRCVFPGDCLPVSERSRSRALCTDKVSGRNVVGAVQIPLGVSLKNKRKALPLPRQPQTASSVPEESRAKRRTIMRRIFLIGYMGAGKTTLGKAFARSTGLTFVDLDWYAEERFHRTVGQLFAERGEDGFRQLERNMLHEVGEFEDVVVATGGGTPCFFDNMEYMNACGQTVFLDVPVDVLFRRLRVATRQRPILQGKTDEELRSFIVSALEARLPRYTQAHYRFDGSRLESRGQIAASVAGLRELLGV